MKNEVTTNITAVYRCKLHHRNTREIDVMDYIKRGEPLFVYSSVECSHCPDDTQAYLRAIEGNTLTNTPIAEQTESVPNESAIRTVQRLLNRIDDLKDELVSLHKISNAQIVKADDLADDNARLRNVLDMIFNVADPSMEKHFGAPSDWLAQIREMAESALEVKADER